MGICPRTECLGTFFPLEKGGKKRERYLAFLFFLFKFHSPIIVRHKGHTAHGPVCGIKYCKGFSVIVSSGRAERPTDKRSPTDRTQPCPVHFSPIWFNFRRRRWRNVNGVVCVRSSAWWTVRRRRFFRSRSFVRSLKPPPRFIALQPPESAETSKSSTLMCKLSYVLISSVDLWLFVRFGWERFGF